MQHGSYDATIFDANTLGNATLDPVLVRRFVDLESQTPEELRHALWGTAQPNEVTDEQSDTYDYKCLRAKPLLRAKDGRAIILDPRFMSEKFAVGPLFHVLKISDGNANSIFDAFGRAFEKHVQEILRRCFPRPSSELFDPLACGIEGRTLTGERFEIDACLSCLPDLILFEVKGAWAREAGFLPENSVTLLQSLRRQYGRSKDGNKGVAQLARIIRAIARGEFLGPLEAFRQVRRVIPVLVVHDTLLGAPGFGNFLTSELDRLLEPCEWLRSSERKYGSIRVASPVVLTIEDLESLEVSLEHFSLRDVLVEYSDTCPDRMMSFHDFLATSPNYSNRIYANRFLASSAMEPLKLAMARLFGQPAD